MKKPENSQRQAWTVYSKQMVSKQFNETHHPSYRPGTFSGYSHAWNTTDAGLKEGNNPKTKHVNGEPFVRIVLSDSSYAY